MAKVSFPYRVKYMGRHYAPHEPIETNEPEILIADGAALLGAVKDGVKPDVQLEGQTNLFEETVKETAKEIPEDNPKKEVKKRAPRKKAE